MSDFEPSQNPGSLLPHDLDLILSDSKGALIDSDARAHTLTSEGFRAVSKVPLKKGFRLGFTLILGPGDEVKGTVEVTWVQEDGLGGCDAAMRFLKLSWGGARRLNKLFHVPGFDFAGVAWKAIVALFFLVVVAGLHNIVFYHPDVRRALVQLMPVFAALVVVAAALLVILRGG